MTSRHRLAALITVAVGLLAVVDSAHAKQPPEQKCEQGRYAAAAKYLACEQTLPGKYLGTLGLETLPFQFAVSKCRVKYTATWAKPQKKAAGTSLLASLNSGCFAGHCNWRLPTVLELQTILAQPFPCWTGPCVDPIFGTPADESYYVTDTIRGGSPDRVRNVTIRLGNVDTGGKTLAAYRALAGRGG